MSSELKPYRTEKSCIVFFLSVFLCNRFFLRTFAKSFHQERLSFHEINQMGIHRLR